jgi:hypothetical protein
MEGDANMSVRVDIEPDVEAVLIAQAEAQGIPLEQYVRRVLGAMASNPAASCPMTPEERSQAFEQWADAFGAEVAPTDDAMSRESLYPPRW